MNLFIEHLILDGLPLGAEAVPVLKASLVAELSRQLSQGGIDPGLLADRAVPRLRAGDLVLEGSNDPARLGVQLARVVYGGLGSADNPPAGSGPDRINRPPGL